MDDKYLAAIKLCLEKGEASASLIQRNIPDCGFIGAYRILDWMESKGYISKESENGVHKVLITAEKLDKLENNFKGKVNEDIKECPDTPSKIPKIKVFGISGAGRHIIDKYSSKKIGEAECYLVDTDKEALQKSECGNKIYLKNVQSEAGNKKLLSVAMKGADLIILVAGVGGATASALSPVLADTAKELKIPALAFVIYPFSYEGKLRLTNAQKAVKSLKEKASVTHIFYSDRIQSCFKKGTPFREYVGFTDRMVMDALNTLIMPITNPLVLNIDFVELKSKILQSGETYFGVGVALGEGRSVAATRLAVQSPLEDKTVENFKNIVLFIEGGKDLSINEVTDIAELIKAVADESAEILFAARIDENIIGGEIKVSIFAVGRNNSDAEQIKHNADDAELRYKALKLCLKKGEASVSMMQRSFPIGYEKACRLIDWMEENNYISAANGSMPRQVFITEDELKYFKSRYLEAKKVYEQKTANDAEERLRETVDFFKTMCLERLGMQTNKKLTVKDLCTKEEFADRFAELMTKLIRSDKKMSRQTAIGKAKFALECLRETENNITVAVFEQIVSELRKMTNSDFSKIRDRAF